MSKRVPGRFITLEGGEGAGKSSQLRRLAERLKRVGIDCVTTREPGGSPGAEEIRTLLVNGEPGRWDAITETLLMFAARADHVARTIKPALERRQWVLSDRFTDSTYAYQGAGRSVPRETIRRIESVVLDDFKPDLTLILDVPADVGLGRAKGRGPHEDRFERFDESFHKRLREAFLSIARRSPDRCAVIDASAGEDDVAEEIWRVIKRRYRVK
jgi:dTMP kinase